LSWISGFNDIICPWMIEKVTFQINGAIMLQLLIVGVVFYWHLSYAFEYFLLLTPETVRT